MDSEISMTEKERYELSEISLNNPIAIITDDGEPLTQKEVADLLNKKDKKIQDLENTRLRKNKEISKYKAREERYQRIVGGLKAYFELEANNDLWWDWNE